MNLIGIVNRALDMLGKDTLTSLTDGTETANLCSRNIQQAIDIVISAFPWNSATARASLPALTTTPAWGFGYEYMLPSDCLTLFMVEDQDVADLDLKVEGRKIRTSLTAPLNVLYALKVTDPASLHPALAECIAARLAADIAYKVTGSSSMADSMEARFKMKRTEAYRLDSREGTPGKVNSSGWLESRQQPPTPGGVY